VKKTILLLIACTGFAAAVPFEANALEPQAFNQNNSSQTGSLLAQMRRRGQDRQFAVYYRRYNNQQWTLDNYYQNRRNAQLSADRLERRGYRTYVQVSRRIPS
jgi:hypothetical protein